jgi:hypothetical protein
LHLIPKKNLSSSQCLSCIDFVILQCIFWSPGPQNQSFHSTSSVAEPKPHKKYKISFFSLYVGYGKRVGAGTVYCSLECTGPNPELHPNDVALQHCFNATSPGEELAVK